MQLLAEWIAIEKRGLTIEDALRSEFSQAHIVEHFETFFRFRIDVNVSIGKVFGYLERNKATLNIDQYSVKQTSIEQIFNGFANGVLQVKTSEGQSEHLDQPNEIAIPINKEEDAKQGN